MSISCQVRSLERVSCAIISLMLVLSEKDHLQVHLGSHLVDHDALRVETFETQCGDVILFASTLRHWGLTTLPGVGKPVPLPLPHP